MRRKDGKIDRRSKEYQDAVARMAKARAAMKKQRRAASAAAVTSPAAKPSRPAAGAAASTSGRRRTDGRLDQRTAEGKAVAERMAAMRAKRGKGKKTGFFAWLFGG